MDDAGKVNAVADALRKLSQNRGVQRSNIWPLLTPELTQALHISENDSSARAREKATQSLEQLTVRLNDPVLEEIARYSFNITGIPEIEEIDGVVYRQRKIPSASQRDASKKMSSEILPTFARDLLTDPPPPLFDKPEPNQKRKKVQIIAGSIGAAIILVVLTVLVTLAIDGTLAGRGASSSPADSSAAASQDPKFRVCRDIFTSTDFTDVVSPVSPDAIHWGHPETYDYNNCDYELDEGHARRQVKIHLSCGSTAQSELSKFQTRQNRRASSEVPKALMYSDAIALLADDGTFIEADYWLTSVFDTGKQHLEIIDFDLERIIRRLIENESKRPFCQS